MDPIAQLKEQLSLHPQLRFTESESALDIQAPSADGFDVSIRVAAPGYTVSFDGWHEEFTSAEEALRCVAFAFSGECRLAVTYRGGMPVKWVLEHLHNGQWQRESETGLLLQPFWLPRRVVYRQNPNLLRPAA